MRFAILALAVLIVGADAPDKALQGEWVVARAEREGKEARDVVGHKLVVDGETFEIREGDKLLFKGTVEVDKSSGSLWLLDVKHSHGDLAGKKWLGVMRVRDDGVLDICDNAIDPEKPRPKELKSEPDSGTILLEFRRPKK
jgi:uncharacterized protein (TIGR03067 family)